MDYDRNIHHNPDAMAWAKFFVETTKDMGREVFCDEGYMVGWFANAMMAMHDSMKPHEAADEIERLREALNGAYTERNRVVALLASVFPSGLKRTSIPDWDEEWNGCVYIDLPTGQASWHFHDREAHLFSHLPPYEKEWDGHTTEEKYDRLARSALQQKESK